MVDPRRTETAELADHHLAPAPGTDHLWLAAVVRELLKSVDRQALERRAEGVETLERAVAGHTLTGAANACGLALADLDRLVGTIRRHGRVAFQSGTGVTMTAAGTATEWLLWALAVVTDSLDVPGGVWFNPGFLRAAEERRSRPVAADGAPGPSSRPELRARGGERPSVAIVDEIEAGNLRALLLFGGSLLTALPDVERTRRALGSLEILAVLDIRSTGTAEFATHVLPTLAQLERADLPYATDTYTPAVATQYTDAVLPVIARRRPAWWILASLAERLGHDVLGGGMTAATATVDDVLGPLVRRHGVDLAALRAADGAVTAEDRPIGWVREAVLAEGRWQIAPPELVAALTEAGSGGGDGQLRLVPRRQLRHLNSQLAGRGTRDGRADLPRIQLAPENAERHGLTDGDVVRLRSPHGTLDGVVEVDADLRPDAVSVPHGYEATNVNRLTHGAADVDVRTGMPRFSGTPVELVPADDQSATPIDRGALR